MRAGRRVLSPGVTSSLPPQPGTLIEGKYEILTKIREGGMGTIYKVRHRLLDEVRVVKVMRPHLGADEDLRRRFAQEAKTATKLKHPNIVHILDFALDADGTAYIVMEFIDGVNLLDLLRVSGPPSVPLSLEIARQTLQALSYLHRKSMVHRDIAPDNLMLTHDEEQRPVIKLIDLGIAKDLDRTVDMTSTGVFLGKVKYSSPEQLGGLAKGEKIDGRSDLYSLGVVLYELLTGEKPIAGETPRDLLAGHLFSPPRPFEETDPTNRVPESVRQMLLKALEKPRERRFQTPGEFASEVDRLQRQAFASQPDLDDTRRLLARARDTSPPLGENITPSAQDRLDRQFGAASTPPPTGPSGISAIENAPTIAATTSKGATRPVPPAATAPPAQRSSPRTISGAETVRATGPGSGPALRRPVGVWVLGGLLLAGVAAFLLLRGSRERGAELTAAAATPAPSPVDASVAEPTAAPVEAAAPTTQVLPPPPAPEIQPTSPPEPPPAEPDPALRRRAETARANSDLAERRAERAGAARRSAQMFSRARDREAAARRQQGRGELAAAAESFAEAERLYRQAESEAKTAALAESAPTAAPAPTLVARVEPTRAPTPFPAPTPVPPTARPAVPAPPPAPSEEDRVRETLAQYRQSQNSLDVALYARVYPAISGATRARVEEAYRNLRSQTLELDIQSVEVTGNRATARVFETRTAVPRIGAEQRDQRNRVIRLEKRGESWVIAEFE
jgi:serine/threonine-protein kinase